MTSSSASPSRRPGFLNQPIRRQIVAMFLVYLVIVVGLIIVIERSATVPQEDLAALSHATRVTALADALTIALAEGQTSYFRYLTTGMPVHLDQLAVHQADFRRVLSELEDEIATSSPGPSAEHWPNLEQLAQELRDKTVMPGIALRQAVDNGTATREDLEAYMTDPTHQQRLDAIRDAIDLLAADERLLSAEYAVNIANLAADLRWIYLVGALILLGFGVMIAIHIDTDITAPLQRMTRLSRDIAGGNLDLRFNWSRTDEIGQVASTFDEMVDQLRTVISAQQASLRDLQQKEAVQAAMLDGTVEGLALISPDYRIILANHRLSELLGTDVQKFQGQDVMSLIPVAHRILMDPERVIRDLIAMFRTGDDSAIVRARQHYPELRELEAYSTTVRGNDGENLGRLFAVRDVTSERQSDRMKTEFVSMVSHELRTPLTSVKGYVDLLREGELGELTEDQLGFLTIVANSTDRLIALINDLLDISRIEAGKLLLNLEPLDVATRIHEVVASLRPRLEEKRQVLTLDLPSTPMKILGDSTRIDQILSNLLSNAIKYTPEEGSITIRAELDATTLRLHIIDSGIGIAEADRDQLFTRFYRSADPAVRQISGTGLGLAITRSLVELHGGEISVESELGVGSTFSVSFPRVTAEPPDWMVGLGRFHHHILIVLDNEAVADGVRRIFQSYGHDVNVATTAAEGLRLAREVSPALVVVGDQLPDSDGLSVIRHLRAEAREHNPAIVLVSYAAALSDESYVAGGPDWISSHDGAGATTTRSLPPDPRVFQLLALEGNLTMLLGGNNARPRTLLANLFRRGGHDVVETASGVAAVEVLLGLGNTVDLALLNSSMSDDDQFELMRSLRTNVRTQGVPLIALFTDNDASDATRIFVETLSALILHQHLSSAELVALVESKVKL